MVETTLVPVKECRRGQPPECIIHTIQRGEKSLASIGRAYGVSVARVRALNPRLKRRLRPGDEVVLPLTTLEEKIINELQRENEATGEWAETINEANKVLARRVRELERNLLRSFEVRAALVFEKWVFERELANARDVIRLLRVPASRSGGLSPPCLETGD